MRDHGMRCTPFAHALATSHVSRALGLAESIEGWVGPLGENGVRAVASEIVVLLKAARDELTGYTVDE